MMRSVTWQTKKTSITQSMGRSLFVFKIGHSNKPIDYVTVCSRLTETGVIDSIGGASFVSEIIEDQASSANIYHYAKTVKDKSSMREIIRTAQRVAERGFEFTEV